MKTFILISLLSCISIAGCRKEIVCIGPDCTLPEAVVLVDSISHKHIYATLLNSEGVPFACPLTLSPLLNEKDFIRYAGYHGSIHYSPKSEGRILKVYYVSEDQSYVLNGAEFIHAFNTNLEIVAFGDELQLTY